MSEFPWKNQVGAERVAAQWVKDGRVRECLAAQRQIDAKEAVFAGLPALAPPLLNSLAKKGIHSLYSHQIQAIEAALNHRHTLVATPTASGKSLCFHLPVLQAIHEDPSATALFLYPTKALSRDQESSLHEMLKSSGLKVPSIVFDGDTPGDARRSAREKGKIILTNPDMLHAGILPNHAKWATFFQGLKYVVLDEMHTYRGVFGSHMSHVIARLKRIAAFHGASPTFIGATATIGNPKEHASLLLGVEQEDVALVQESGAPTCERKVFLYNPPIVNAELGVRGSSLKAAVRLAADLVKARVPTIVFAPSRNSVEVMLKYLRQSCSQSLSSAPGGVERAIMGYRGGYLPKARREIERGLREGEILCVVATNALELGIDIGDLDAVVCAGYPGSVAGTWQRFGRAGRRNSKSIAVMVLNSGAVDQYLARDPEYLLDSPAEQARVEPENAEVTIQHLKCAAFEAPFIVGAPGAKLAQPKVATGENYLNLGKNDLREALEYLTGLGLLHHAGGRYHWAGDAYPASNISLRNIGWDNFVIIDQGSETDPKEETIGELDYRATHTMLHEQAIYQQDAEQYQVERLDFDNHKAFVRKVEPDYFTTALTYKKVKILDSLKTRDERLAIHGFGDVQVIEKVTGYKKIKFFTHENSGYGDVHLPEMEMHTTSYWITLPEEFIVQFERPRAVVIDGLQGLGQLLETVAALALMCDPKDLGQSMADGEKEASSASIATVAQPIGTLDPTLFVFDAHPGGVGLAGRIFERSAELLERCRELLLSCECSAGCPACVGPSEGIPKKAVTLEILEALEQPSPVFH